MYYNIKTPRVVTGPPLGTRKCLRCGSVWNARTKAPVQCPRCKRCDWAEPKLKRGQA